MRAAGIALLFLAALVAGCFGPAAPGPQTTEGSSPQEDGFTPFDPSSGGAKPSPSSPPSPSPGAPIEPLPTEGQEALVPAPPALFSVLATGREGAEPSIGITARGNVFVTAGERLLRSSDAGKTWSDVTGQLLASSFDPYLWIDPTTNRVFHVNLQIATSYLTYSDTEGDAWTQVPISGGAGDHEKLSTGPSSAGFPGSGTLYPNVVYYAVNGGAGSLVSTSLDGGRTWGPLVPIGTPGLCGTGGINGQPHGTERGTVLLPYYQVCGVEPSLAGYVYVASSTNGVSWSRTVVTESLGAGEFDPDLASDADGNVFLAFMAGAEGNHSVYVSRSKNDGQNWDKTFRVAPDPLGSTIFPTIVAGAAGELWVSYLATDDTTENPDAAPAATEWYLYASHVSRADTSEPRIDTYLVDPHPVQLGRISTQGFTGGDADRNLLEFIDSALDLSTGRLWIVYADGCPEGSCTRKAQSVAADTTVARLDAGPSILAPGLLVGPPAE